MGSYDSSFTLHNLENNNVTYNYTISTELYDLDYSCEKPQLYLESGTTETNDPALLIKDDNYNISFNYEIKSGNKIAFSIVDTKGVPKYTVLIDDKNAYYITKNSTISMRLNDTINSVSLKVNSSNTTIRLGQQTFILKTAKDYTKGYIHLETNNSYAEFTNFVIERGQFKEPVTISIAESKYTDIQMTNDNTSYYTDAQVNLTNYTITTTFRTLSNNILTLSLRNSMIIRYDKDAGNITINDSKIVKNYPIQQNLSRTINDITAKINNKTIDIYYNGDYVTSINNTNTTIIPKVTYTNITINDMYIKANNEPEMIHYTLAKPTQTTAGLLTVDSLKYFKENTATNISHPDNPTLSNVTTGLTEDEKSMLEDYFNRTRINYTDYRITTVYNDKTMNNTLSIALVDLYSNIYAITINDTNKTANIRYTTNRTEISVNYNITTATVNRLIVDVKNSTLSINMNNKNIFTKKVDKYTQGVVLFDNRNINVVSAQIEDRTTGQTTIYQKQLNINCDPLLKKMYVQNGNITIADKDMKIIKQRSTFNETFDIAKVQVSLDNGQEIHYWTKFI
jgi:hypothetical protein